ncbi:MAG: hypothetical protein NO117_06010 [Sulfolobales archaeon]|nr:hypothetical protein [Sulfolobales archaeon]
MDRGNEDYLAWIDESVRHG